MSENRHGYLNGLLSELMGLEASLIQLKGLVKQSGASGDNRRCDEYKHELTRLSLRRQELIVQVEKIKQQESEVTDQKRSELEKTWLNIKETVQQMLDNMYNKR